MTKKIITISREFGSGGRFIGEEVAKKLGIAYYDKNIINEIAEKSGLSPKYIQENAELSPKKMQRICQIYHVSEKDAVKMMEDTDKRRMTNYNFYTEQKWGKASNYTLSLNSSQFGYDRCENIIMECSK